MASKKELIFSLLRKTPMMHSREFVKSDIDTKTLTRLANTGKINRISRGLYTLPDYVPGTYHSLIETTKLIENSVICLLSALEYYEIGTQNPSEVWIALDRTKRIPGTKNRPVIVSRFSGKSFTNGISNICIDNIELNIYNIPKTIADCFKFRNKIGNDVAIEALKDVLQNKKTTIRELLHYADICRVKAVMIPYLESLT